METAMWEQHERRMSELIRDNNIESVRIEAEDMNAVSRGFTLDIDFFLNNLQQGFGIPKGIYGFRPSEVGMCDDTGVMGEVGHANGAMYPDLSTFSLLPWEPKVARVLAEVRSEVGDRDSPLFAVSPRNICKVQLQRLWEIGLQLYSSFEFEFYLLSEAEKAELTDDGNVFSTYSQSKFLPFVKEAIRSVKGMSIRPELHHSECGPGQQEITCSPEFGICSADNAFTFKHIMKEVASKHNMLATFMSLPIEGEPGSSGHYNHSLWDLNGKCLMYDSSGAYGFSEIAKHWFAGLLHHSRALVALAAPLCNCYERISPECDFSPFNNAWGFDNRTIAYRIKNKHSPKMFIDNRVAGAAVNPYLLVASCIIAGMDGIKRKMKINIEPTCEDITMSASIQKNIENLPTSLKTAMECLLNDKLFVNKLGEVFMKCYVATLKAEYKVVENTRSSGKHEHNFFQWYRDNYAKFI